MGYRFCLSPSLDRASTACLGTVHLGSHDCAYSNNRNNEGEAGP